MNVHENARLAPRGRVQMMDRIDKGVPVRQAAADAGVSERTAHRWLKRWRSGDRALYDRSSAPFVVRISWAKRRWRRFETCAGSV